MCTSVSFGICAGCIEIRCTFPRNSNSSWFLSRKLLSAEIWKISPAQLRQEPHFCFGPVPAACVWLVLSWIWHRFAFLQRSLAGCVCVCVHSSLHSFSSFFAPSVYMQSWSMLQQNSISLWFVITRQRCLVAVAVFATMEFRTQPNEIGSGHKKWTKLNYSLISSKPNTLSEWISPLLTAFDGRYKHSFFRCSRWRPAESKSMNLNE